jgi:GNAT superfamily N-acetyltransferase
MNDQRINSILTLLTRDYQSPDGIQLRGMATHPEHQHKGLGKQLLLAAINKSKTLGRKYIWCNARVSAVDFYTHQGFSVISDEFIIDSVGPHVVCLLDL